MSVDLISNLTPQEIFNKSKKTQCCDRRPSVSVLFKTEVPQETGPKVHEGFSEEASVCLTVSAFSVHKFLNDFKPFLVSSLSLPLSQR